MDLSDPASSLGDCVRIRNSIGSAFSLEPTYYLVLRIGRSPHSEGVVAFPIHLVNGSVHYLEGVVVVRVDRNQIPVVSLSCIREGGSNPNAPVAHTGFDVLSSPVTSLRPSEETVTFASGEVVYLPNLWNGGSFHNTSLLFESKNFRRKRNRFRVVQPSSER